MICTCLLPYNQIASMQGDIDHLKNKSIYTDICQCLKEVVTRLILLSTSVGLSPGQELSVSIYPSNCLASLIREGENRHLSCSHLCVCPTIHPTIYLSIHPFVDDITPILILIVFVCKVFCHHHYNHHHHCCHCYHFHYHQHCHYVVIIKFIAITITTSTIGVIAVIVVIILIIVIFFFFTSLGH